MSVGRDVSQDGIGNRLFIESHRGDGEVGVLPGIQIGQGPNKNKRDKYLVHFSLSLSLSISLSLSLVNSTLQRGQCCCLCWRGWWGLIGIRQWKPLLCCHGHPRTASSLLLWAERKKEREKIRKRRKRKKDKRIEGKKER